MQHQALRLDVGEYDRRRPLQPFVESLGRHMIKLPRRLRNDIRARDRPECIDERLGIIQHLNVLAWSLERRFDVFLADVNAPIADVPDPKLFSLSHHYLVRASGSYN